jgi:hypothetical protein
MISAILPLSLRHAKRTSTLATMHKVDTALGLFKTEQRVYPWDFYLRERSAAGFNATYPDLDGGEKWSNRLAYHLATDPDTAPGYGPGVLAAVRADLVTARSRFGFDLGQDSNGNGRIDKADVPTESPASLADAGLTFRTADQLPYAYTNGAQPLWNGFGPGTPPSQRWQLPIYLNRLAQVRFGLAVIAGATGVRGPRIGRTNGPNGVVNGVDRSGTRVLPNPASAASPGWACDYLGMDLVRSERRGEEILDAWGTPLVYVCQVLPGMAPNLAWPLDSVQLKGVDPAVYGLAATGRLPTTQRNGDIRTTAARSFVNSYELWSAGYDHAFAWMRDDRRNLDNVAAGPYMRDLK